MPTVDRRGYLARAGVAVTAASLSGCLGGILGGGGPVKRTNTVKIDGEGTFVPKNAKVERREQFTIENRDDVKHRVTGSQGLFLDEALAPGTLVTQTLNTEGVYLVALDYDGDPKNVESFDGEKMKLAVGSAEIEDPIE